MPPWTADPETKADLDDAFQLTNPDGASWGHVTRGWVEFLLVAQYERGVRDGRASRTGRVISTAGSASSAAEHLDDSQGVRGPNPWPTT